MVVPTAVDKQYFHNEKFIFNASRKDNAPRSRANITDNHKRHSQDEHFEGLCRTATIHLLNGRLSVEHIPPHCDAKHTLVSMRPASVHLKLNWTGRGIQGCAFYGLVG